MDQKSCRLCFATAVPELCESLLRLACSEMRQQELLFAHYNTNKHACIGQIVHEVICGVDAGSSSGLALHCKIRRRAWLPSCRNEDQTSRTAEAAARVVRV